MPVLAADPTANQHDDAMRQQPICPRFMTDHFGYKHKQCPSISESVRTPGHCMKSTLTQCFAGAWHNLSGTSFHLQQEDWCLVDQVLLEAVEADRAEAGTEVDPPREGEGCCRRCSSRVDASR